MGQIGQTLGNLVGIGQNPGLDTYGASPYGQNYSDLIQQQQGNLNATNAAQTALATQLGNIAQGQGPNPAQAMLNQSTGQNVSNQASLAAGQRGASQNVGMIQRQAANQGRQAQQQAAGQGASMQAQQSLGALGQQAGVLGQQGQQAVQGMGAYEAAINSANQVNAQTAANAAQFGQGFGGGLLQGVGSMLAEGGVVKKFAQGGDAFSYGNSGDYTTPMGDPNAGGGGSFIGNFLSGSAGGGGQAGKKSAGGHGIISGVFKGLKGMSKSGANTPMAGSQSLGSGENYNSNLTPFGNAIADNPGMAAGNAGYAGADAGAGEAGGAEAASEGEDAAALLAAKGGKVPALVSKGEHILEPGEAKAVAKGKVNPLKVGERVPGTPKYKGNNYANDVVRKGLPEGGVVIPNSIMQSKNPERGAAEFVRAVLAKKKRKA